MMFLYHASVKTASPMQLDHMSLASMYLHKVHDVVQPISVLT